MRRLILRDLGALVAALLVSITVNFILARVGLALLGGSIHAVGPAAACVVMMFLVVPAAAGVVLGVLAAHPVSLAFLLVALSLGGTYLLLGPDGLPGGWKIVEYLIQAILIAGAAALVSAHRRRVATRASEHTTVTG